MMRSTPALVLLALAASVPPPAVAQAAPAAPAAAPAPAPKLATPHVVHLRDGSTVPCVEPPLVAMGRVLYRTADGARHALPIDRVDLDKTRPSQAARPPVAASAARKPSPPPGTPAGERRAAPDFTATRPDGTTVKLSDLKGKVVLLDFWATWCGPCVYEMPNVKQVYKTHAGKDFEIVGISLDHARVELDAFVKAQGLTWPQSFDGKGWANSVARQYGVQSIPAMMLLDRQGRVARVGVRGPLLGPAVAEMIAEPVPPAPPKQG